MASKLNPVEQRALLREYAARLQRAEANQAKYKATKAEVAKAAVLESMWFDKQREFFMSPHTRKVGLCTRRAGKTIGSGILFVRTLLLNPTSLCLYVAQTSQVARLYLWKELRRLVSMLELPFEFNETNLMLKHKRAGGTLIMKGADKADEIEKLRGPKWRLVVLDEAASFGAHFEKLVFEVVGPALRDENGTLLMIGSPGSKKEGLFHDAATGKLDNYEVHSWSLVDNPYLSDDAKDLAKIRKDEGFSEEDPRYLREYLCQWITADSERVFNGFSQERNVYHGELPEEHNWKYLLGCDFGWNDETAVSLIAYADTSPVIYIVETWARKHALPSHVAASILDFQARYGVRRYIGDTGGYGKAIVVQLAHDYNIMMQPAKKHEKLSFVEFMNSEFYTGKIKIHASQTRLIEQFITVAWNADRTEVGKHERDDLAFSAVYGWRAARNSGAGRTIVEEETPDNGARRALRDKLAALRGNSYQSKESWHGNYLSSYRNRTHH